MLIKYRKTIKTIEWAGYVLALLIMSAAMAGIALVGMWLVSGSSFVVRYIFLVIVHGIGYFGVFFTPTCLTNKMHEILFAWQDKKIYEQLQKIREAGILSVPTIIYTDVFADHDCSEYFLPRTQELYNHFAHI